LCATCGRPLASTATRPSACRTLSASTSNRRRERAVPCRASCLSPHSPLAARRRPAEPAHVGRVVGRHGPPRSLNSMPAVGRKRVYWGDHGELYRPRVRHNRRTETAGHGCCVGGAALASRGVSHRRHHRLGWGKGAGSRRAASGPTWPRRPGPCSKSTSRCCRTGSLRRKCSCRRSCSRLRGPRRHGNGLIASNQGRVTPPAEAAQGGGPYPWPSPGCPCSRRSRSCWRSCSPPGSCTLRCARCSTRLGPAVRTHLTLGPRLRGPAAVLSEHFAQGAMVAAAASRGRTSRTGCRGGSVVRLVVSVSDVVARLRGTAQRSGCSG